MPSDILNLLLIPAAFGRLRVETTSSGSGPVISAPAAFGRLRVETSFMGYKLLTGLPAAFGRLRVETLFLNRDFAVIAQPPSGGCVLKPFHESSVTGFCASRLRAAAC